LWEYFVRLSSNRFLEIYFVGEQTSIFASVYLYTFGALQISAAFISIILKRVHAANLRIWLYSNILILSLFVFGIPFSTRLGPHHFISVYFLMALSTGGAVDIILSSLSRRHTLWIKLISGMLIMSLLTVSAINRIRLGNALEKTGGLGYYSEEYDKVAYNALSEKEQGIQAIYYFPEWGFMSNFNFLTNNTIKYQDHVDEKMVQQSAIEYDVIHIFFADKINEPVYVSLLDSLVEADLKYKTYFTRDGKETFYSITVIP